MIFYSRRFYPDIFETADSLRFCDCNVCATLNACAVTEKLYTSISFASISFTGRMKFILR